MFGLYKYCVLCKELAQAVPEESLNIDSATDLNTLRVALCKSPSLTNCLLTGISQLPIDPFMKSQNNCYSFSGKRLTLDH